MTDRARIDMARIAVMRIVAARTVIARIALALAVLAAPVCVAAPASAQDAEVVCRFSDKRLDEISGMALSRQYPDVIWLHNDSSGGPRLYAVSATTCKTLATVTIANSDARDYEAIAIGTNASGRDVIWLGDIGDNRDSWPYVEVVRVKEPRTLADKTVRGTVFRFTYDDRPHNAEALLAHGTRLWVVTKQLASGSVYALPDPLVKGTVNIATRVGGADGLVTDGSVAPDGARFALRDYWSATIFDGLPPGEERAGIDLPAQEQGEAMTWTADGTALLVASEADRRLLRVPVDVPAPGASPAPTTDAGGASDEAGDVDAASTASGLSLGTGSLVLLVVALAVAVIVVAETRRRRH